MQAVGNESQQSGWASKIDSRERAVVCCSDEEAKPQRESDDNRVEDTEALHARALPFPGGRRRLPKPAERGRNVKHNFPPGRDAMTEIP